MHAEQVPVVPYTHATGTWVGPVRAGVNLMGLSPDQVDPGALDNHGRPALVVDGQGYIHLIFGGHGGSFLFGENKFGTPGSGRQTHVVTEKPGDISSWKVLDNVPPFGTYGQWVKLANNDIYLYMYLIGDHGAIGRPTAETSHLGDRLESIKSMPPSNAKAEAKRRKKAALGD